MTKKNNHKWNLKTLSVTCQSHHKSCIWHKLIDSSYKQGCLSNGTQNKWQETCQHYYDICTACSLKFENVNWSPWHLISKNNWQHSPLIVSEMIEVVTEGKEIMHTTYPYGSNVQKSNNCLLILTVGYNIKNVFIRKWEIQVKF